MAVNLKKNKTELEQAWEEIRDPNSKNDWVVFGYTGKSYDLKVVEKGDEGLEEMIDELSSGKILYAGCRIIDPNTKLPKIVFVNWQGEGVPPNVKGACANHLRDITGFFKGAHVTINARCEDDLDPDTVKNKVEKSSGANFSYHKEKPRAMPANKPVKSVYQPIRPEAEINLKTRDKFWSQQERDEQERRKDVLETHTKERDVQENKRLEREKKETAARDESMRERSKSIEDQRAAQKQDLSRRKIEEKEKYEETQKEMEKDDEEFRHRSDSLRKERLGEVGKLIKARQESFDEDSLNPKETFGHATHNVSLPVVAKKKRPPPPVSKRAPTQQHKEPVPPQPEPLFVVQPEPEPVKQPELIPQPMARHEPRPEPQPTISHEAESTIPHREPDMEVLPQQHVPERLAEDNSYEGVVERPPQSTHVHSYEPATLYETTQSSEAEPEPQQQHQQEEDNLYDTVENMTSPEQPQQVGAQISPSAVQGLTARAVYDYQAEDEGEINFDPGDIITNVDTFDEGWWKGIAPDGCYGMFPSNYVELIDNNQIQQQEVEGQYDVPEEELPQEQPVEMNHGLSAKAIYDYQAEDDSEITFDPGDIITNIEQVDEGWWRGIGPDSRLGLFPANYVELIA